jgi:hypothetical protein
MKPFQPLDKIDSDQRIIKLATSLLKAIYNFFLSLMISPRNEAYEYPNIDLPIIPSLVSGLNIRSNYLELGQTANENYPMSKSNYLNNLKKFKADERVSYNTIDNQIGQKINASSFNRNINISRTELRQDLLVDSIEREIFNANQQSISESVCIGSCSNDLDDLKNLKADESHFYNLIDNHICQKLDESISNRKICKTEIKQDLSIHGFEMKILNGLHNEEIFNTGVQSNFIIQQHPHLDIQEANTVDRDASFHNGININIGNLGIEFTSSLKKVQTSPNNIFDHKISLVQETGAVSEQTRVALEQVKNQCSHQPSFSEIAPLNTLHNEEIFNSGVESNFIIQQHPHLDNREETTVDHDPSFHNSIYNNIGNLGREFISSLKKVQVSPNNILDHKISLVQETGAVSEQTRVALEQLKSQCSHQPSFSEIAPLNEIQNEEISNSGVESNFIIQQHRHLDNREETTVDHDPSFHNSINNNNGNLGRELTFSLKISPNNILDHDSYPVVQQIGTAFTHQTRLGLEPVKNQFSQSILDSKKYLLAALDSIEVVHNSAHDLFDNSPNFNLATRTQPMIPPVSLDFSQILSGEVIMDSSAKNIPDSNIEISYKSKGSSSRSPDSLIGEKITEKQDFKQSWSGVNVQKFLKLDENKMDNQMILMDLRNHSNSSGDIEKSTWSNPSLEKALFPMEPTDNILSESMPPISFVEHTSGFSDVDFSDHNLDSVSIDPKMEIGLIDEPTSSSINNNVEANDAIGRSRFAGNLYAKTRY